MERIIGGTSYCKRCGRETYPNSYCECHKVPKEIIMVEDEIKGLEYDIKSNQCEIKSLKEEIKIKKKILKKISPPKKKGQGFGNFFKLKTQGEKINGNK